VRATVVQLGAGNGVMHDFTNRSPVLGLSGRRKKGEKAYAFSPFFLDRSIRGIRTCS
jgi:hypothetical protein